MCMAMVGKGEDKAEDDDNVLYASSPSVLTVVLYETCSEFASAYGMYARALHPEWTEDAGCVDTRLTEDLDVSHVAELLEEGFPFPGICEHKYVSGIDAGCFPDGVENKTRPWLGLRGERIEGYDGIFCSPTPFRESNEYEFADVTVMSMVYTAQINPFYVERMCNVYGEAGHMNYVHFLARLGGNCKDEIFTNQTRGYPATFARASVASVAIPGIPVQVVCGDGRRD